MDKTAQIGASGLVPLNAYYLGEQMMWWAENMAGMLAKTKAWKIFLY